MSAADLLFCSLSQTADYQLSPHSPLHHPPQPLPSFPNPKSTMPLHLFPPSPTRRQHHPSTLRLFLLPVILLVFITPLTSACSCPETRTFSEKFNDATTVIRARVKAIHTIRRSPVDVTTIYRLYYFRRLRGCVATTDATRPRVVFLVAYPTCRVPVHVEGTYVFMLGEAVDVDVRGVWGRLHTVKGYETSFCTPVFDVRGLSKWQRNFLADMAKKPRNRCKA